MEITEQTLFSGSNLVRYEGVVAMDNQNTVEVEGALSWRSGGEDGTDDPKGMEMEAARPPGICWSPLSQPTLGSQLLDWASSDVIPPSY